ncbi:hypothetical protein J2755_001453 [Methanohalophilus levihalophilus]|uniref:hypothetical protein n=1 Tax=Methanohalophilus levihalophilus TaxID=1431282 RepID=UPI001AE61FFB|nr:hypothetical protein [Methanohalophilus levihalophilus]MBP2030519.1 hypothetical protein [Methanohalophilus levihalophilus]
MNSKTTKLFAFLSAFIVLTAVVPSVAFAYPDSSEDCSNCHNGNDKKLKPAPAQAENRQVNANQIRAENASGLALMNGSMVQDRDRIQYSKQIKNDYQIARNELNRAKTMFNNGSATEEDLFNISKDYLNTTIDYMISNLNETKTVLEDNDGDEDQISLLEGYIADLEEAKEDLDEAEDRKDLADIAKSVRETWREAHKDINLSRAVHLVQGLEQYIVKADRTSERLSAEITRLNESGVDTSEAEELLEEYNSLVADASEYLDLARDNYQSDTTEAAAYVQLAINSIKEANMVLRDLLDEIKDHRPGYAKLGGSGNVNAEGNGTAVLSGNMDIEISATNATLVIKDLAGDATIEVDGAYDLFNGGESRGQGTPAQVYHNFTGDASISGSRLTVVVHGFDISIEGEGSGSVLLSGEGTYDVEGDDVSSQSLKWANSSDDDDIDEDDEEEDESEYEDEMENETEDDDLFEDDEDGEDDEDDEDEGDEDDSDGNETEDME